MGLCDVQNQTKVVRYRQGLNTCAVFYAMAEGPSGGGQHDGGIYTQEVQITRGGHAHLCCDLALLSFSDLNEMRTLWRNYSSQGVLTRNGKGIAKHSFAELNCFPKINSLEPDYI